MAELEEKAEENLLMLCEEKERQQEKLYELKREILLREREEKLDEELVKQVGSIAVCSTFEQSVTLLTTY